MSGTVKRTLKNGGSIDQGAIDAIEHNAYAGAKKVMNVGPEFFPTTGADASAGSTIAPGSIVGLFNNSTSVAWVALSNATIGSAPSGFSNGIPLKPNDWTWLNMGENEYIRTSANTVGVYTVKDDSTYQNIPIP